VGDLGVERFAVGDVGFSVTIVILITPIAIAVTVEVGLVRVFHTNTIVLAVGYAVTVLVAVAFVPFTVTVEVRLLRVAHQLTVVRTVGHTVIVVVAVTGVAVAVAIGIHLLRVLHANAVVGVVRDAVAVPFPFIDEFQVAPLITQVTETVAILILLPRVFHANTIVSAVRNVVSVVVVVDAVGLAIFVQVGELVVRDAVAIVVQAVTFLRTHTLPRVAKLGCAGRAIVDGMLADAQAAHGAPKAVVYFAAAVVVHAVAGFGRTGVHLPIERLAVQVVGGLVVVVVQVARVAFPVKVGVGLVGVGHRGTVVIAVIYPVAVVIHGDAVGYAVGVGVFEVFVCFAVAVVVLVVAQFVGASLEGVTNPWYSVDAVGHRVDADPEAAGLGTESLVYLAVAIVVQSVAFIEARLGSVAGGEPLSIAMALTETCAVVVGDCAVGPGAEGYRVIGALAVGCIGGNALGRGEA